LKSVTSLAVRIAYENTTEEYKPTAFSISEALGTKSERGIHSGGILTNGGTHEEP
jgi:hypothetical protein